MSKTAVVTGASSGIGAAIASRLLDGEWNVIALCRRRPEFESERLTFMPADLSSPSEVNRCGEQLRNSAHSIDLLVNNAGVGFFAPHEELPTHAIEQMVALNLLAPLLLTRHLLRPLKASRGAVINISSMSAIEASSFGAAYAATKAGIRHFGTSLFEEVRKSGVRVTTIAPDITKTPFFENATFEPEEDEDAFITPECVADTVMNVINQRRGTVMTEIVLRPQRILLRKSKGKNNARE